MTFRSELSRAKFEFGPSFFRGRSFNFDGGGGGAGNFVKTDYLFSDSARVVNLFSGIHFVPRPGYLFLSATKF